MSVSNVDVNTAISASGEVDSLLIEKLTNRIHEATLKAENLLNYFDVQDVTGTDSVSEKFMGDTELEVLAAGQAPNGQPVQFDKNQLVIDTVVIGRNYTRLLSDVQTDIAGLHSKLANQQANKHKKLEDEMVISQLIYSGMGNTKAVRTKPRVSGHGFSQDTQVKDAYLSDPEGLQAAVEFTLEKLLDGRDGGDGQDLSQFTILMPWKYFNILRDAERIVSSEYQTFAGDTVNGFTLKSFNVPVVPTNRMPTAAKSSKLSNAANGNRYDFTAAGATTAAILFTPDALLVGRSIALTADIWFDKNTKSWAIDSWQSEGAIPSVWDAVGLVRNTGATAGADDTEVKNRANRKATRTKAALA